MQCVAFVCYKDAVTGQYRSVGTAVFIGIGVNEGRASRVFLVTAGHIIKGLRRRACTEAFIRVNINGGGSRYYSTNVAEWIEHPSDTTIDVAILERGTAHNLAHLVFPDHYSATREMLVSYGVGPGMEVLITGLFHPHVGDQRNIPIVRMGTLACFDTARISVKDYGMMDGYLLEVHSTGGLSGSPVFLHPNKELVAQMPGNPNPQPAFHLIGIIQGHFYDDADEIRTFFTQLSAVVDKNAERTAEQDGVRALLERINTHIGSYYDQDQIMPSQVNQGIAIVTPFERIREVIVFHLEHGTPTRKIIGENW